MNLRSLSCTAMALALAASTSACAVQSPENTKSPQATSTESTISMNSAAPIGSLPEEVDVPISDHYSAIVTLNGEPIEEVIFTNDNEETGLEDTTTMKIVDLPGAPADYLPMRLVCGADPNGYTYWSKEENAAVFVLHGSSFIVYFDDLSVEIDGEKVDGVTAYLADGVTYLPTDFLSALEGVAVDTHPELSVLRYDITLKTDPLTSLVEAIQDRTGMSMGQPLREQDFALLEMDIANFESLSGCLPMMVNADTIFIGKYAPDADKDAARADFEEQKAKTIQNFENYLPDPLEMAKQGQIVESKDGNYLMLIISPDNEKAIAMFEAGVSAIAENTDLEAALAEFPAAETEADAAGEKAPVDTPFDRFRS